MERLVHAPDTKTPLEDVALVSDLSDRLMRGTDSPRHESAMSVHQQLPNAVDLLRSQLPLRCRLGGVTHGNRAHFHRTVVATLDIRMILVAGNQQECAHLAIGEEA